MKKLFFIALVTLSIATSAFANSPVKISKSVTNSFNADFRDAQNVNWTTGANYIKASFTMNDKKMEAYYDNRGEVIARSTTVSLEQLPLNAKRAFAKKFTGYTVKEAIHFEGAEETAYYISAENDKTNVILKVNDNDQLVTYKTTKK